VYAVSLDISKAFDKIYHLKLVTSVMFKCRWVSISHVLRLYRIRSSIDKVRISELLRMSLFLYETKDLQYTSTNEQL